VVGEKEEGGSIIDDLSRDGRRGGTKKDRQRHVGSESKLVQE
jgi:hypothetical protein